MKVTEQLKLQHEQILAIFDELEFTVDAEERTRLAGHLAERIKAHAGAEEEIFFPALEQLGPETARAEVKGALEAHRGIDVLLDEFLGSELTPPAVNVLRTAFEEHIAEIEERLLPMAEELGEAALTRLAMRVERYAREADDGDENVSVNP